MNNNENNVENGLDLPLKRNNKTRNIILVILAVITVAAIGITVWALFFRDATPVLAPDYAPQTTDSNAEKMDDGDESKLDAAEGGGAVSLTYSKNVTISLADKKASIMFQNPSKSTQNMVLQLVITSGEEETVVAQSNLLPAGYKLNTLALLDTAKLSAGGYEGKFRVLYYNTDSGEKAVVNTEIPVSITAE